LADAKTVLSSIQTEVVTRQIEHDAEERSQCPDCGKRRKLKDYRLGKVDTLFGGIEVHVPRFEGADAGCDGACALKAAPSALSGRSTPKYDTMRVKLAAQLPFRVAGNLLAESLPVSGGATNTTIRNRTFAVAEQIATHATERAAVGETIEPARALTLQLDHTYIRAAPSESTRHLQVLAGEIEPDVGGLKRRFASLDEDRKPAAIVREHLNQSGYT
jgi:hypothetical protein